MNGNRDLKLRTKFKMVQRTQWSRIEKKLANSNRTSTTHGTFLNYLRNKTYLKEHHINMMNGDRSLGVTNFDPNLVMDIRHKKIFCHRKFNIDLNVVPFETDNQPATHSQTRQAHNIVNAYETEQLVQQEADKFKENLELQRPMAALDFFEYLHSHTKYKYIREKINRYHEIKNDENLAGISIDENNEKLDGNSVSANGFQRKSISEITDGFDSDMDDCGDCDDCSNETLAQLSDNTMSQHADEYPRLQVNLVPKYAPEPLELCGIGTNFQTMKLEEVDPPVETVQPQPIQLEHGNGNSIQEPISPPPLNENLKIIKVNIDQMKRTKISNSNLPDDSDDIGMGTDEKNALLCEIFCEKNRSNFVLLQKYFLKWFHFNTIEKLSKQGANSLNQTRLQKIQKFLQNITIERKMFTHKQRNKKCTTDDKIEAATKRRDAIDDPLILSKKYNTKLKIQQDIIELQKIKLERQERIINDLKLAKITDDVKDSQAELKKELRQVIQKGCQPMRSKARCLQIIGNLKDAEDDDEYAKLQAKGLTMPKFLIEMHARALEREIKHQQAKERREHLEKDREKQRLDAEEAKRLQDEESKRQRIEELRRKRREEKLLKIKREQERQSYIANMKFAEKHYRLTLLKMVVRRFRILIAIKRRTERKAAAFRMNKMRTKILHCWKMHVENAWHDRKSKADLCHNKQCLRSIMNLWKQYYLVERSKKLIAEDWHDMKISERAFAAWNCVTIQSRLEMETKMKQAETHYTWNLKWRILDHWRRLQVILQIERETEERRNRWRHKIWELLPDYRTS